MPVLLHMGPAAPCGLTRYESDAFGKAYQDNLFACYFNLHKVSRHVLTPQGATFTTKDEDFVSSSDLDFHPTDVIEDADGSLVIVDTGGWYKLCCPTSQLQKPDVLGAIYRVQAPGHAQDRRSLGNEALGAVERYPQSHAARGRRQVARRPATGRAAARDRVSLQSREKRRRSAMLREVRHRSRLAALAPQRRLDARPDRRSRRAVDGP